MANRPVRMEDLDGDADGRRFSPSAGRNQGDIVAKLAEVLPPPDAAEQKLVLEIASGTGEHAVAAARTLPGHTWQPTDRDAEALKSARAWHRHAGLPNLLEPLHLDLEHGRWPDHTAPHRCAALVAINILHIAPWSTTRALLQCATDCLDRTHGVLAVYGAFFDTGHPTAESNLEFDRALRDEDPALGVRSAAAIDEAAREVGLVMRAIHGMPNNNFLLEIGR